ncbi:DUF2913 family protein [Vibrio coralliilyticus]|uniref:DUF2913 family protein n=1 Tax=Vibrio coralliilyticus TaxID=190893 RepID=UPI000BAC1A86|nr:DUF2913 family protein [Vibrio coralliilyticus]NOI77408.1 DUF2913 family protein [Vibrio coralliilyticus]PAW02916.1 hypothetical protein CKJ79_14630 [Vibrio coralliilyticus]
MKIKKDLEYYHNLRQTVTHALLHLLVRVSASERYTPLSTRNEILVKFLKPKLHDKSLSNIKKDLKIMLSTARQKGASLEHRLYELNEHAKRTQLPGVENLYALLVHLYEEEGIESRRLERGTEPEPGILYMIEESDEPDVDPHTNEHGPLSMRIQAEAAPSLISAIHRFGGYTAEMREWDPITHRAHILLQPAA